VCAVYANITLPIETFFSYVEALRAARFMLVPCLISTLKMQSTSVDFQRISLHYIPEDIPLHVQAEYIENILSCIIGSPSFIH
jgi:hypothetical protein